MSSCMAVNLRHVTDKAADIPTSQRNQGTLKRRHMKTDDYHDEPSTRCEIQIQLVALLIMLTAPISAQWSLEENTSAVHLNPLPSDVIASGKWSACLLVRAKHDTAHFMRKRYASAISSGPATCFTGSFAAKPPMIAAFVSFARSSKS